MPEIVIGGTTDLAGMMIRMAGIRLPGAIAMMTAIDLILAVHQGTIGTTETMTGIGPTVTAMTIWIRIMVYPRQRVLRRRRRRRHHLLFQQTIYHNHHHRQQPPAGRLLQ
jgi:hypothetical protein